MYINPLALIGIIVGSVAVIGILVIALYHEVGDEFNLQFNQDEKEDDYGRFRTLKR